MHKHGRLWLIACGLIGLVLGLLSAQDAAPPAATNLRFEVAVARGLLPDAADGRVLVVLGRDLKKEPRLGVSHYTQGAGVVLGSDLRAPAATVVLDQTAMIYPLGHLAQLPAGTFAVQAVLQRNRDLCLVNAPGNLYSTPLAVTLDPARGGTVRLELTKALPVDELPADTDDVKFFKLRSAMLTQFHGRPMYLRAGLILPRNFARDPERRYPLRVHIGGYGTRYTAAAAMMSPLAAFRGTWLADDTPRMLLLHLDGAGPYGDPYQVNSANNGPCGDAIIRELIPYVEEKYRGIGAGHARVLDGGSTGGWVSLALQIFYPDFFAGTWSHAPDPVDFRAYELLNIYQDDNAYVNAHGFERPASRDLNGDVRTTVRHECRLERVLGRSDRWELSGMDWCAWNATFGPRGADGLPQPLWDGKTGKLDRAVTEHWKKYDLRLVLQNNWPALAPKLAVKFTSRSARRTSISLTMPSTCSTAFCAPPGRRTRGASSTAWAKAIAGRRRPSQSGCERWRRRSRPSPGRDGRNARQALTLPSLPGLNRYLRWLNPGLTSWATSCRAYGTKAYLVLLTVKWKSPPFLSSRSGPPSNASTSPSVIPFTILAAFARVIADLGGQTSQAARPSATIAAGRPNSSRRRRVMIAVLTGHTAPGACIFLAEHRGI